eukprot:UN06684
MVRIPNLDIYCNISLLKLVLLLVKCKYLVSSFLHTNKLMRIFIHACMA